MYYYKITYNVFINSILDNAKRLLFIKSKVLLTNGELTDKLMRNIKTYLVGVTDIINLDFEEIDETEYLDNLEMNNT